MHKIMNIIIIGPLMLLAQFYQTVVISAIY